MGRPGLGDAVGGPCQPPHCSSLCAASHCCKPAVVPGKTRHAGAVVWVRRQTQGHRPCPSRKLQSSRSKRLSCLTVDRSHGSRLLLHAGFVPDWSLSVPSMLAQCTPLIFVVGDIAPLTVCTQDYVGCIWGPYWSFSQSVRPRRQL
ncbi:hypothetical protein NDU88_003509 [Pleurodeles waltl]|uniref:Uncharacterized protein n=1 Tax=Pleurodeles waltl TaxID=8319 RepID=A0AAV7QCA8_PLEWA|nr:hypothetical protein NDU88_003509 [Pleurodeles waltl]